MVILIVKYCFIKNILFSDHPVYTINADYESITLFESDKRISDKSDSSYENNYFGADDDLCDPDFMPDTHYESSDDIQSGNSDEHTTKLKELKKMLKSQLVRKMI